MKTTKILMPLLVFMVCVLTFGFTACSSSSDDETPEPVAQQIYTVSYSGSASDNVTINKEVLMVVNSIQKELGVTQSTATPVVFSLTGSETSCNSKVKAACDKVITQYASYKFSCNTLKITIANGSTTVMSHTFK